MELQKNIFIYILFIMHLMLKVTTTKTYCKPYRFIYSIAKNRCLKTNCIQCYVTDMVCSIPLMLIKSFLLSYRLIKKKLQCVCK